MNVNPIIKRIAFKLLVGVALIRRRLAFLFVDVSNAFIPMQRCFVAKRDMSDADICRVFSCVPVMPII